jgi:hypothetical protein
VVISLVKYAKAVMYAYPLLKSVEKDYDQYIRNKALLSYKCEAFTAAWTIAKRIEEKRSLVWLRERVDKLLKVLPQAERVLVETRYFGKKSVDSAVEFGRSYFRRQNRLAKKIACILSELGVTQEVFDKAFADMDIFQSIYRFAERKGAAF